MTTGLSEQLQTPSLRVCPLTLRQANQLVGLLHRHHKPVAGHRFSLGLIDATGSAKGAIIVGRPVARLVNASEVAEVTRLVTDGTQNACSMLLGAAARAAKAMGFYKIQTYILHETETGVSLKAAGWQREGISRGGSWNRPVRGGRREDQPQMQKERWSRTLCQNDEFKGIEWSLKLGPSR